MREPECRIKRQPNEVGQELVVKRNETNNSVYQGGNRYLSTDTVTFLTVTNLKKQKKKGGRNLKIPVIFIERVKTAQS